MSSPVAFDSAATVGAVLASPTVTRSRRRARVFGPIPRISASSSREPIRPRDARSSRICRARTGPMPGSCSRISGPARLRSIGNRSTTTGPADSGPALDARGETPPSICTLAIEPITTPSAMKSRTLRSSDVTGSARPRGRPSLSSTRVSVGDGRLLTSKTRRTSCKERSCHKVQRKPRNDDACPSHYSAGSGSTARGDRSVRALRARRPAS